MCPLSYCHNGFVAKRATIKFLNVIFMLCKFPVNNISYLKIKGYVTKTLCTLS